jgi:hypothetical protein
MTDRPFKSIGIPTRIPDLIFKYQTKCFVKNLSVFWVAFLPGQARHLMNNLYTSIQPQAKSNLR